QRHDAVSGELIDRSLEPMNSLGEDREEAIHDLVPFLGIDLLGEIHRPLHVGEEDSHLLPFAFECASRCKNLLGEVLRCIGTRGALDGWRRLRWRGRSCTFIAKLRRRSQFGAAMSADSRYSEWTRTLFAEFCLLAVLMTAGRALQPASSLVTSAPRIGAPISTNSRCASRRSRWRVVSS